MTLMAVQTNSALATASVSLIEFFPLSLSPSLPSFSLLLPPSSYPLCLPLLPLLPLPSSSLPFLLLLLPSQSHSLACTTHSLPLSLSPSLPPSLPPSPLPPSLPLPLPLSLPPSLPPALPFSSLPSLFLLLKVNSYLNSPTTMSFTSGSGAYTVVNGIDACRVGILPLSYCSFWNQLEGWLVQVVDIYKKSCSTTKQKKAELSNGCVMGLIVDRYVPGDEKVSDPLAEYETDSSIESESE